MDPNELEEPFVEDRRVEITDLPGYTPLANPGSSTVDTLCFMGASTALAPGRFSAFTGNARRGFTRAGYTRRTFFVIQRAL